MQDRTYEFSDAKAVSSWWICPMDPKSNCCRLLYWSLAHLRTEERHCQQGIHGKPTEQIFCTIETHGGRHGAAAARQRRGGVKETKRQWSQRLGGGGAR